METGAGGQERGVQSKHSQTRGTDSEKSQGGNSMRSGSQSKVHDSDIDRPSRESVSGSSISMTQMPLSPSKTQAE